VSEKKIGGFKITHEDCDGECELVEIVNDSTDYDVYHFLLCKKCGLRVELHGKDG